MAVIFVVAISIFAVPGMSQDAQSTDGQASETTSGTSDSSDSSSTDTSSSGSSSTSDSSSSSGTSSQETSSQETTTSSSPSDSSDTAGSDGTLSQPEPNPQMPPVPPISPLPPIDEDPDRTPVSIPIEGPPAPPTGPGPGEPPYHIDEDPDQPGECPVPPDPPRCINGYRIIKNPQGCVRGYDCNKIDEGGHNGGGKGELICISGDRQCPDGCGPENDKDCSGVPEPPKNLPPNCWYERDDRGMSFVKCREEDKKCPEVTDEMKNKCIANGGRTEFFYNPNGCNKFECRMTDSSGGFFSGPNQCPNDDDIRKKMDQCNEAGMKGVTRYDRGCKIVDCINPNDREFIGENKYSDCSREGGEITIVDTPEGDKKEICIRRGDSSRVYVEDSNRMPSSAELLSIATNLEEIMVEFDKLSRRTKDIAKYYQSVGSDDEVRFNKISDMFIAAKNKVQEIKGNIRDSVRNPDEDSMFRIRNDIKYLKEVTLNDILFYMLSNSDEVEEFKATGSLESGNCESDERCFGEALRLCKPVTFYPPEDGPTVEVKLTGAEDGKCIMKAEMVDDEDAPGGGPYTMTCKIPDYANGIRNPDQDIFPYCEGNLADLMKKYGPGSAPPGVPGKCSGDECKNYCGRGPSEAKECLKHLDDVLPDDARENLKRLAESDKYSSKGDEK